MLRRILLATAGVVALTGAAAAAELLPPKPLPPYVPPPPPPMWTGFYAGLNAGWTFGGTNNVNVTTVGIPIVAGSEPFAAAAAASTTGVLPLRNEGFIGGGQIGYNYQFANAWVVGVEADIQGTGARDSDFRGAVVPTGVAGTSQIGAVFASNHIDYLGTVRGRIGWLVTPTFLIFGDGGFAYGGVRQDILATSQTAPNLILGNTFPAFARFNKTRPGWTAGGGLEWMFMPNWSVRAEYLYYDLGRETFIDGAATTFSALVGANAFTTLTAASTRWNGHIARAALNYHFFWGAPPVVAKY
jgi:outer membrane immunogenic protein